MPANTAPAAARDRPTPRPNRFALWTVRCTPAVVASQIRLGMLGLSCGCSGGLLAGDYNALTNAVASATEAGTIYIIEITKSFTFSAGGQVSISKLKDTSLLQIKSQKDSYTLTGNGNRLFTIAKGQGVTFQNLTLTKGSGVTSGGAILDKGGFVTLSHAAILSAKNPFLWPNVLGLQAI